MQKLPQNLPQHRLQCHLRGPVISPQKTSLTRLQNLNEVECQRQKTLAPCQRLPLQSLLHKYEYKDSLHEC